MKRFFSLLLLLTGFTYAQQGYNMPKAPSTPSTPYSIPFDVYKSVLNTKIRTDMVVRGLDNLGIAQFPKFRPLKLISDIYLHTEIPTTIIFPGEIIKASVSFPTKNFTKHKNLLIVQPQKDFVIGTIEVLLNLNGKEVYTKLTAFRINPYKDYPVIEGGVMLPKKYEIETKPQIFYPVVIYVDRKILSPLQVLERYREYFGHYPEKDTLFYADGIGYQIYVKPRFPNVIVENIGFRVEVAKIPK